MNAAAGPAGQSRAGRSLLGRLSQSQVIYLGLVLAMVVLQWLKVTLPLEIKPGHETTWLQIAVVATLGWIGVILSPKTGFPEMWDRQISIRQRLAWPALWGILLGLILVGFDWIDPMGSELQVPYPDSLVVYALGGLIEEIEIHLFATPFLIWIFSGLLLRGRYQEWTFWIVAGVGGLAYWGLQIFGIASFMPERLTVVFALQLLLIVGGSITGGAYLFRKGGFLAALTFRYGIYLIWHILWAGGIGLVHFLTG